MWLMWLRDGSESKMTWLSVDEGGSKTSKTICS